MADQVTALTEKQRAYVEKDLERYAWRTYLAFFQNRDVITIGGPDVPTEVMFEELHRRAQERLLGDQPLKGPQDRALRLAQLEDQRAAERTVIHDAFAHRAAITAPAAARAFSAGDPIEIKDGTTDRIYLLALLDASNLASSYGRPLDGEPAARNEQILQALDGLNQRERFLVYRLTAPLFEALELHPLARSMSGDERRELLAKAQDPVESDKLHGQDAIDALVLVRDQMVRIQEMFPGIAPPPQRAPVGLEKNTPLVRALAQAEALPPEEGSQLSKRAKRFLGSVGCVAVGLVAPSAFSETTEVLRIATAASSALTVELGGAVVAVAGSINTVIHGSKLARRIEPFLVPKPERSELARARQALASKQDAMVKHGLSELSAARNRLSSVVAQDFLDDIAKVEQGISVEVPRLQQIRLVTELLGWPRYSEPSESPRVGTSDHEQRDAVYHDLAVEVMAHQADGVVLGRETLARIGLTRMRWQQRTVPQGPGLVPVLPTKPEAKLTRDPGPQQGMSPMGL